MSVKKVLRAINPAWLLKQAAKISKNDLDKVIAQAGTILNKARGGSLRGLLDDIYLLVELVRDYAKGRYRDVPWRTVAAAAAALLYVANPIDLIPDYIPGVGYVDDAAVVRVCLSLIGQDLATYKAWRKRNGL